MVSSRSIRAGAAYIELTVENSRLLRGLRAAQAKLRAFATGVKDMGAGLLKASTLAAAPLAFSARTFGNFSDQMAIVRAVTGASVKDFAKLNDRAKELGRTTSFTASEVASAMVALGRAGFSTNEILSSIAGTLDLARAGALDLSDATTIMADLTRSFGLTADEAGRVGDILAKTANISNTSVELVGNSMKYVASSANLSGQSLERVSAALAVLANRGLKGDMAGASVAMSLTQLAGSDVQKKLASMGVAVTDAQGNMRDLLDIVRDLGKVTANMGNAQKLSTFKDLFDQRGMRSMILLSENVGEWDKLTGVIRNSGGTASKVAKQMDDTLGGSFRMLMSAVEGVQIALGEALEGTLREWMDWAANIAGKVTNLIIANKGFIVSAMKIIAVSASVGAILMAVGTAGSALAFTIGELVSLISGTAAAVGFLGSVLAALLTPIGLVTAAISGLAVYIIYSTDVGGQALDWLGQKFDSLKNRVTEVMGAIGDALAAGDIALAAKVLWLALKVEWQRGLNYINELWETLYLTVANVFDRIVTIAINTTDGVYTAFRNAIDSIYKLVLGISEFIAKAFWSAVQGVVDSFAYVMQSILGAGYLLNLIDENEVAELDAKIRQMKKGAQGFTDERKKEVENFYQGKIGETDARQQERTKQLNDRMFGREENRTGREDERAAAYKQDLLAAQQELEQAKAEWGAAAAEARQKRDAAAAETPDGLDAPSLLDELKQKLSDAGSGLQASADKISVQGTFNPAAMLSLQGNSSTAERTAKAAEDTAKNTKKLVDESKLGGLTFS